MCEITKSSYIKVHLLWQHILAHLLTLIHDCLQGLAELFLEMILSVIRNEGSSKHNVNINQTHWLGDEDWVNDYCGNENIYKDSVR